MKNKITKILLWLKEPPGWFIALIYPILLAVIAGAMVMLGIGYSGALLSTLAYVLFALSAILLSYCVYLFVIFAPTMKKRFSDWTEQYDFLYELRKNFGFRTVVFAVVSLALSIAIGLFNGVIAILSLSIWYGALASYYILLALMRGGIIVYHNKKRMGKLCKISSSDLELERARNYRNSGMFIVLLDLALSVAVTEMVISHKFFSYSGIMIYASAAYAFYKITMSIVNLLKAKKQDDLTVQAIRNINLADAMVSILALQTALLNAFGEGGKMTDTFNALTGLVVCLATLALGVIMFVSGMRKMKELKTNMEKQ